MACKIIKGIKKFFAKIRKAFSRNKKVNVSPSAKAEEVVQLPTTSNVVVTSPHNNNDALVPNTLAKNTTVNVWNAKNAYIHQIAVSNLQHANVILSLLNANSILARQDMQRMYSPFEQICMLFDIQSFHHKQARELVFEIDIAKNEARIQMANLQESTKDWGLDNLFALQDDFSTKATGRVRRTRANRRKTLVAQPDLNGKDE